MAEKDEITTMSINGTVDKTVEIDGRIETTIDYSDDLANTTSETFKSAAANVTEDLETVFPTFQDIKVTRFEVAESDANDVLQTDGVPWQNAPGRTSHFWSRHVGQEPSPFQHHA